MKTAMKKLFSLVLVAVLLVGVMPFQAFAEEAGPEARGHIWPCGVCGETGHYSWDTHCPDCNKYNCICDESEPIVCENCGGDHATDSLTYCSTCEECGDHDADDHCKTEGCGKVNCNVNHCDDCKKEPCECPDDEPVIYSVAVHVHEKDESGYWTDFGVTTVTLPEGQTTVYLSKILRSCYNGEMESYEWKNSAGKRIEVDHVSVSAAAVDGVYSISLYVIPKVENDPPAPPAPPTVDPTPDEGDDDDDDEDADPKVCSVCGKEEINDMCNGCKLDEIDCTCTKTTTPENHWGEIKFIPMFNDGFGLYHAADPVYVKMGSTMADVFAKIAVPADYNFSYWSWDVWGNERINNYDRIPNGNNFVIYAQYAKQVQALKGAEIYLNLNYNWKMGETLKDVAIGSRMGDVLKNIKDPFRWGYEFVGWYWDADCKNDVEWNDKVLMDCVIFAKWEKASNEAMLKIYVNGNTKSPAKIVDLHDYAKDGWISIDEVKEAVKEYYTAKDSDGLSYYGLYDTANWQKYLLNHRHPGSKYIEVNKFDDTTVYVMVYNAAAHSSANADTTNPKTGDMIFTSVTVLGASASCLAVLFYLNKKRAV